MTRSSQIGRSCSYGSYFYSFSQNFADLLKTTNITKPLRLTSSTPSAPRVLCQSRQPWQPSWDKYSVGGFYGLLLHQGRFDRGAVGAMPVDRGAFFAQLPEADGRDVRTHRTSGQKLVGLGCRRLLQRHRSRCGRVVFDTSQHIQVTLA